MFLVRKLGIRKAYFLAVGGAREVTFWPTLGLNEELFDSFGVKADET